MKPNFFDAHTHLNFAAYESDRDEVVERALAMGVAMNFVGTQQDTSVSAVALAERFDNTYASIGLHPIHTTRSYHDEKELGEGGREFTSRGEAFDADFYAKLGHSKKVIAIGECGLDYYRCDENTIALQKKVFSEHIALANRLEKPLMLHIRPSTGSQDAYLDALEMLSAQAHVRGDVHFFAGNWDTAKKFLDLGFTLSFTGVLTFARDYDDVVRNAPLDMLLTETDAPYVAPVPHRGRRNEPSYIPEVVKAIAHIRGGDFEVAAAQLIENARRVFKL